MGRAPGAGGGRERQKFYDELGADLCSRIAIVVRYDSPDENGETRRQRNQRFGMADRNPLAEPVPGGDRLEGVFWNLSRFRTSGFNGPEPLQPGAVRDWCAVTGRSLSQPEIEIIFGMDAAYLDAARREIAEDPGVATEDDEGEA